MSAVYDFLNYDENIFVKLLNLSMLGELSRLFLIGQIEINCSVYSDVFKFYSRKRWVLI